jgi:hypothetical protein
MTPTGDLSKLREPFPADQIHKLPKPLRRDAEKGYCRECNSNHGLPALHLDYVGHAEVTARLLDVDPLWNWEPAAVGADGLPALSRDSQGRVVGMWIRLTIAGVTRLGYGSVDPGVGDAEKQLIGDAIRNAAMRFGVALDLWSKSERAGGHAGDDSPRRQRPAPAASRGAPPRNQLTRRPARSRRQHRSGPRLNSRPPSPMPRSPLATSRGCWANRRPRATTPN